MNNTHLIISLLVLGVFILIYFKKSIYNFFFKKENTNRIGDEILVINHIVNTYAIKKHYPYELIAWTNKEIFVKDNDSDEHTKIIKLPLNKIKYVNKSLVWREYYKESKKIMGVDNEIKSITCLNDNPENDKNNIEFLKNELNKAIENEDYILASQLKKQIDGKNNDNI